MSKIKGTKAEREILQQFWETGTWAAIRAPGSGSARFPSPDIIAGNATRKLAIECKSTKKSAQYLTHEEINQLKEFAEKFNAEPWISVKFDRKGCYFLKIKDLKKTPKFFAVKYEDAVEKGINFTDLTDEASISK